MFTMSYHISIANSTYATTISATIKQSTKVSTPAYTTIGWMNGF